MCIAMPFWVACCIPHHHFGTWCYVGAVWLHSLVGPCQMDATCKNWCQNHHQLWSLLRQGFRLNLMGRVSIVKAVKSIPICQVHGATFYIDGSQSENMVADYLFPAWLIPRAEKAEEANCTLAYDEVQVTVKTFPSSQVVPVKLPYLKPAAAIIGVKGPVALTRPWFDGEAQSVLQAKGARLPPSAIKTKSLADALIHRSLLAKATQTQLVDKKCLLHQLMGSCLGLGF